VGWLVVNLGTAFMAGWVVSLFDPTIAKLTVLAVYMPIVREMGGNTSAQAMSVAIRDCRGQGGSFGDAASGAREVTVVC